MAVNSIFLMLLLEDDEDTHTRIVSVPMIGNLNDQSLLLLST